MSKSNFEIKNEQIGDSINSSLNLLRIGNFKKASEIFTLILKKNYSNSLSESGIKCSKYWQARMNKVSSLKRGYEKGKMLIDEWKRYEVFVQSIKNLNKKVYGNIQFFVFSLALESLKSDLNINKVNDLETIFMIALSYKKIGDFANAIVYFEKSLSTESKNSNVLAQLADCYALIDNERKAKVLFKEAFYVDAPSIEINLLDSNIINTLVSKIEQMGVSKGEVVHWLPVYARVFNVFNVCRELLPLEVGQLKQKIFSREKQLASQPNASSVKAGLLNSYLWYYDYLTIVAARDNVDIIEDIKVKIQNISEEIYEELMSNRSQYE